MPPADDDITPIWRVSMIPEIAALKLEFDANALPTVRPDLPLRLTIRVTRLHRFNHVAKFLGHHPKQEHHALLVDRFVAEASEINRVAVGRPGPQSSECGVCRDELGAVAVASDGDAGRRRRPPRGGRLGQKGHHVSPLRLVLRKPAKPFRKG